jgi:6,7-dimethyl-8-ribityllumazine synthase
MLQPLPERPDRSDASHRIVVVASRYNDEFVGPMTQAFLDELSAIEPGSSAEVIPAPGSFEIPHLAARAVESLRPDAIVCLGVILQGETGHADLVASSVSDSLCRLSVEKLVPVIHGVLLLGSREQASARCLGAEMNRGTECARAVVDILRSSKAITSR